MPGELGLFWKKEIESAYKDGMIHTFIVYLNAEDIVRDEVHGYMPMKAYIMEQLNLMGVDVVADAEKGGASGHVYLRKSDWWINWYQITKYDRESLMLNDDGANNRKKLNEVVIDAAKGSTRNQGWGDKAHEGGNMPAWLNLFMYNNQEFDLKLGLVIKPLEGHGYLYGNIMEWATSLDLRERGYAVVAIANNLGSIPEDMRNSNDIKIVRIPYPDYTDRLEFIKHLMSREIKVGIEPENLARITGGMELTSILPLAKRTVGYGKHRSKEQEYHLLLDLIEGRKQRIVKAKSHRMLETLETADCTFEKIGGLENVKSHLRNVVSAIIKGDRLQTPAGILFLGTKGAGKLLMAKTLANEANMTCVQLKKLEDFCSNSNSSEVLELIRMLSPVVVLIDDIDNPENVQWGRTEGSKVPIPQELLDFMSELSLRGRILWIATSSRPDKIDPVFSQSGRFADKLLFLMPDKNDREDIIKKLFTNSNIPFDDNLNFSVVADDKYTHNCTSAELWTIVQHSRRIAQINGREAVSQDDLVKVADNFIPSITPEMSEYFTLLAIREVNSREFIPPNLPPQIKNVAFDGAQISRTKIDGRLEELAKKLKIK